MVVDKGIEGVHATATQKRQALRGFLSLDFIRSAISSLAYYVHEQVLWRSQIHLDGPARIHPTASIRNAANVHVGKNSHINHNCCIWAGEQSGIRLGADLLMGP